MLQVGIVRKTEGKKMEIEVRRTGACGGGEGCSGGCCEATSHFVTVSNDLNAKAGDVVEIQGNSKNLLKYTAIIYLIPLALLVIGTFIGINTFKGKSENYELMGLGIGLIGLVISGIILKIVDKRYLTGGSETFTVKRII